MSKRKRPNVLWIQTDEQRHDSLGCSRQPWAKTPNIDALAARGTAFHQCHVQSPMCVPSRTSMKTGTYPPQNDIYSNAPVPDGSHFDPDLPTFPQLFEKNGYRTATFGKWHTPLRPAFQEMVQFYAFLHVADAVELKPGFSEEEHRVIKNPGSFMEGVKIPVILGGIYPYHDWGVTPAAHLTDMVSDWIRRAAREDEPFMVRISHAWPHTPVLVPRPWDSVYSPADVPCKALNRKAYEERSAYDRWQADIMECMDMSMAQWRQAAADYYALCAYVDSEVGRLLHVLDDLELTDNTIIAYNSDHGRSMGEFGHCQKGTFDTEVWRVPFIFSYPDRVPVGEHRDDLCELMDFGATLCAAADIELAPGMGGRDLFNSEEPEAVYGAVDMHQYRRAAIRTKEYRYDCTYAIDREKTSGDALDFNLFNIANDPDEVINLAHDESSRPEANDLYSMLDGWMQNEPKV